MATIHISDGEAARDFTSLLARVWSGEEVLIESDSKPAAVLRLAEESPGRTLSEALAIADVREQRRGYPVVMDDDFAADMREIVAQRRPRKSLWD